MSDPAKERDLTEPFLLNRANAVPSDEESASLEHETLERTSLDPENAIPLVLRSEPEPHSEAEPGAESDAPNLHAAATEVGSAGPRTLDAAGRKGLRFLKQSLLVHGTLLAAVGIASSVRVARIGWAAPELVIGGLGFVLALPCFLCAKTLWGLGRTGDAHVDAQKFAQGIAHLRAMFVVRATLLFTTLAVSCFAFSLVAAFIASL